MPRYEVIVTLALALALTLAHILTRTTLPRTHSEGWTLDHTMELNDTWEMLYDVIVDMCDKERTRSAAVIATRIFREHEVNTSFTLTQPSPSHSVSPSPPVPHTRWTLSPRSSVSVTAVVHVAIALYHGR